MTRRNIDDIREKIRLGKYDMTVQDGLDILDFEQSILYGQISRIEKDDPRGTRYVIEGPAIEEHISVGSVGRFIDDRYLIITIYAIADFEQKNYV